MPWLQSWAQELVGEHVPQEVTYKTVSFVFSVNKISRISPVLVKLWASMFQNLFLSRQDWSLWGKVPVTGWCAPPCPVFLRAGDWCPSWAVVSHHRSWVDLPPLRLNRSLQMPVCLPSWAAWGVGKYGNIHGYIEAITPFFYPRLGTNIPMLLALNL